MKQHRRIGIWLGISFFCVIPTASAQESSAGYSQVQRAFLREKHQEVVEEASAFLTATPSGPEASRVRIWLAISRDRLDDTEAAFAEFDVLKGQLQPESALWPELLYWDGDISQKRQRPMRAKLAWAQLLERFPKSNWATQAHLGLGNMYLAQKAYRSALDHFHAVGILDQEREASLKARLLEGLCLLRLDRFDEAMLALKPLLSSLKDKELAARSAFHLGEAFAGSGRHEEAIQAYNRAIQADRRSIWGIHSLFGVGWSEFQLGRCGESLKTFALYEQREPEDRKLETWFARGSCLVQVDRRDEAVSWLQQVVREEPGHVLACESGLLLSDILREQGRSLEASSVLEGLQRFTWETGLTTHIALRLGTLRLEQGEVSRAMEQFQEALQSPDLGVRLSALNGLGDVHMHLGEYEKAQRRYAEVWSTTRKGTPAGQLGADAASYALYQQGRIHSLQGEISEAIEIFYRLIAQADDRLADDARLALASTYIQQKESSRAQRQLTAIRRRMPDSSSAARAGYYLALLALSEGKVEIAKRFCQEAVDGSARSDEGVEARVLLAQLDAQDGNEQQAAKRLERGLEVEGLAARQRGRLAKERGELARRSGSCEAAEEWHEEAVRLAPMLRSEAHYRIASCFEAAGSLDRALARYLLVSEGPWKIRAHLAAAKLMERQERWEDAELIYEALALEPAPEAKVARELLALRRSEQGMKENR